MVVDAIRTAAHFLETSTSLLALVSRADQSHNIALLNKNTNNTIMLHSSYYDMGTYIIKILNTYDILTPRRICKIPKKSVCVHKISCRLETKTYIVCTL